MDGYREGYPAVHNGVRGFENDLSPFECLSSVQIAIEEYLEYQMVSVRIDGI